MSLPKSWKDFKESKRFEHIELKTDPAIPPGWLHAHTSPESKPAAIPLCAGVDLARGESSTYLTEVREEDGSIKIKRVRRLPGEQHIHTLQRELYGEMVKNMGDSWVPFRQTAIGKTLEELARKHGQPGPRKAVIWDVQPVDGKSMCAGHVTVADKDKSALQAHTIARVVMSREHANDQLLVLTPMEVEVGRPMGFERPAPGEPTSQHMERLASAIDLPIDGYMTWDGIVGFVEEEIAKLKDQRRRAHESARKLEAEAQRERNRANQAADAAGNANHQMKVNTRSDGDIITAQARQIAELKLELRELRKKR